MLEWNYQLTIKFEMRKKMNNRSIETIIAEFQETGSTELVNKISEMASVNKEAQLSEIIDKLPTEKPSFHAKLIWCIINNC